MTKKDTGFDAFFSAVTKSPEFKWAMTKDWSWDFEKSMKDMQDSLSKWVMMTKTFADNFATDEAIETWNSLTTIIDKPKTSSKTIEKESPELSLDVEYFTVKNPDTWWFKWVAWMSDLKIELRESFIKPLKFKFLVEWLEWNNEDEITLEDGTIIDKEKIELYKKLYKAYEKFQVSIPTWLLFYGPPWTWKTFITKKLAQELWAGLIKKSVWEFWSSYHHQTSKNIREFFDQAKRASENWPIILFLDEIDSLVSKRTTSLDANKAEEVSQFLQEFNNLETAKNLIIIAATNRPDHLDSAILRTWRFDKKIYIWAPDFTARKELFEIYIKKEKRPHGRLNYKKLAELTEGYVASDIEWICDEVSRDASRSILDIANSMDDKDFNTLEALDKIWEHKITMTLLEKAISEMPSSLRMVDMSIYEKWKDKMED